MTDEQLRKITRMTDNQTLKENARLRERLQRKGEEIEALEKKLATALAENAKLVKEGATKDKRVLFLLQRVDQIKGSLQIAATRISDLQGKKVDTAYIAPPLIESYQTADIKTELMPEPKDG